MAGPGKKSKVEEKGGSKSRDTKVADIKTAARTLADAADYSDGYPETMQNHINRGKRV